MLTCMSETNQRRIHISISEKLSSLMRIERYKVQWRIVTLKYPVQTRRPVRHSCERML